MHGDKRTRLVSSGGLVVGSVFGLAGTFAPTAGVRGVLWGIDGVALIVSAALLALYYLRLRNEIAAAGFLVFLAGEALILSSAAMELTSSGPVFGAGAALWAAALYLVSASNAFALWNRVVGFIAGTLFAVVAFQGFVGQPITPLTQPLPFFAYPIFVITLLGWAWARFRSVE